MKYIKLFENYNIINVYHGGEIIGDIKPPIYVTDDYYSAKSYNNNVYSFKLDISNFLDLTEMDIFQKVKSKIYDNYSELFFKYKNVNYNYTEERKLNDYNILSKYKDYNSILKRYNELSSIDYIKLFNDNDLNVISSFYKNASKEEKDIINEFETLKHQIDNMNRLNDYSLNMFGYFFYDYCVENNYSGYKAYSTDISGKNRIIEYCVYDVNKLFNS